jgi:hypothetical protein
MIVLCPLLLNPILRNNMCCEVSPHEPHCSGGLDVIQASSRGDNLANNGFMAVSIPHDRGHILPPELLRVPLRDVDLAVSPGNSQHRLQSALPRLVGVAAEHALLLQVLQREIDRVATVRKGCVIVLRISACRMVMMMMSKRITHGYQVAGSRQDKTRQDKTTSIHSFTHSFTHSPLIYSYNSPLEDEGGRRNHALQVALQLLQQTPPPPCSRRRRDPLYCIYSRHEDSTAHSTQYTAYITHTYA